MNQQIKTTLGVAIIIIIASSIGFFTWNYLQNNSVSEVAVIQSSIKKPSQACTQEAKLCPDGVNYVGRTEVNCEFAECPEIVGLADKLVIELPVLDEAISSPVLVTGRARGTWFFEGSFPVEVYDSANKLIGSASVSFSPKSEQDTWMTEEFVDFSGEVKFTQPKVSEGYILFKKDNPSGNPALDESFKLPVKFVVKDLVEKSRIANPASIFCEQNGGKLEIRTEKDDGQVGYCKFSNGTECEEWKYFRGECKQGVVYQNDEYGLKVALPSGFEDFKTTIEKNYGGDGVTYIRFMFKTKDSKWSAGENRVTKEKFPGYADIFTITAWSSAALAKMEGICVNNPTPDCPGKIVGKNSNYSFDFSLGNGGTPSDLKGLFEALNNKDVVEVLNLKAF